MTAFMGRFRLRRGSFLRETGLSGWLRHYTDVIILTGEGVYFTIYQSVPL